ncbi:Uncharacterised protein [Legionella donaldsonii]|uniref:Uncharacterized protein n=1 Tax=Legionella donaldsonii TaxID=45060 RepID=A0A378JDV2_9GAMM|nr:hypothetical protein [Legionella donaldsonii]STX45057.1 Uncharacterised protein [Legionella donaldsonii]
MTLPVKALRYKQLKFLGATTPSGHEVSEVEFVDVDGQTKTGFFKPLDSTYPALLAKYSVAISVALRLALGDRAAEDRLVFDDEGKIVGSISISLPNFKPLLCSLETIPADPQKREQVCPSVASLLRYNVVEWLVAAFHYKCDDRHPGNIGLVGMIDWDMFLYHITSIIKGQRLIDGILKEAPEKGMRLKSTNLDNFPILDDRTHWPSNALPGNLNVNKRCMSYAAFQALAENPSTEISDKTVHFQEQLFAALLKELLTFDPSVLRARLEEYLGDLPLDYFSLGDEKKGKLQKSHPQLFTEQADKQLFIDHMLAVLQEQYDEFYRAVVFYIGCDKNRSGVPVVPFSSFLRNRPSAYHEIKDWATCQNKRMDHCWSQYQSKKSTTTTITPETGDARPLDAYCVGPEGRYNLETLEQRYHKIWRDAHVLQLNNIILEARILAHELANNLSTESLPLALGESVMIDELSSLTEAWQLLGETASLSESRRIECDSNSSLRQGLYILEQFIEQLNKCAHQYYRLNLTELTIENNQAFCDGLAKIIRDHEKDIYKTFGRSTWAFKFVKIVEELQRYYGGLHFQRHLRSTDAELFTSVRHDYPALLKRSHTEEEIVNACLSALFDWANALDKKILEGHILAIIKECYQPSPWNIVANRSRAEEVQLYLKDCDEDGANCLASILSVGGHETTSLNTLLITHLIPEMLKDTIGQVDVNLMGVRDACERGEFDALVYTCSATKCARNDERFTHVYTHKNMAQFNSAVYRWINSMDVSAFQKMVEAALGEYEPYRLNFLSQKRRGPEVRGYLYDQQGPSNRQVLANIFANGKVNENSLNTFLFKRVIKAMQEDFSRYRNEFPPGYSTIMKMDKLNRQVFLNSLEAYAEIYKKMNETTPNVATSCQ